jgi:DNA-binding transcriptional LysR family regulator
MEFRQLEALKRIIDTGSFSEAAKQMNLTQPSISAQIGALERDLGCRLLTRRPGSVIPTETGGALYRYAEQILALRDKAVAACSRREMSGTVTVAASSIPYQFVLPVLTAQFSMLYPGARFILTESGDSASATALVLAGQADLGMVGTLPQSEELLCDPVMEDELLVVAPPQPPYINWPKNPVRLEDVLDAPFVAREEGSGTWAEVERYLERQGYGSGALRVVARIGKPDAIVKAVERGMGVTMLSSLAVAEYLREGRVLAFPLADSPFKRKLYILRRKGKPLSAVAETFARFAARQADGE